MLSEGGVVLGVPEDAVNLRSGVPIGLKDLSQVLLFFRQSGGMVDLGLGA